MIKIAFVVQRYGNEVVGGSEFLCKQIAEHLSQNYQIEVLTTCALDYITWRNEYPEGNQIEQNVLIRRFKTEKERELKPFQNLTLQIFNNPHTELDERYWFEEQGPYTPTLLNFIEMHKKYYDLFIFFTYRYYPSIFGLPLVHDKSILVPTAEDEDTMKLEIIKPFFKLPEAFIFLTPEEQDMINKAYEVDTKVQDTIGLGLDIPQDIDINRFLKKFNINDDYLLYVGRIDPQKGCNRLFDYFSRYKKKYPTKTKLILIGKTSTEIPKHDDIIHLGFLSENDKYDGIKGAKILVMPSDYESYSIIVTEAMAIGTAVLVNEHCSVLKGHCIRSNAGLYFSNFDEFCTCTNLLLSNDTIREKLGKNGMSYVKSNYDWDIIEKKYAKIIESVILGNKLKQNYNGSGGM